MKLLYNFFNKSLVNLKLDLEITYSSSKLYEFFVHASLLINLCISLAFLQKSLNDQQRKRKKKNEKGRKKLLIPPSRLFNLISKEMCVVQMKKTWVLS